MLFSGFQSVSADIDVKADRRDEITVESTLKNPTDQSQPFAYIVEVKDATGVVVFLTWQTGILSETEQPIEIGWHPDSKLTYSVQYFLWTGLENPVALTGFVTDVNVKLNSEDVATCMGGARCFTAIVTKVIDGD